MRYASIFLVILNLLVMPVAARAENIKVVTSFSILADMTQRVGEGAIDLSVLVGPNQDVHTYDPTSGNIKSIGRADIFIVNGFNFEGWRNRLVEASEFKGILEAVTRGIDPLVVTKENGTKITDPHAWQTVANAKRYVENIRTVLSDADPKHADLYQHNASVYLGELDALENWVKTEIAKVPPAKRKVITSHDAFGYFSQAYDIEFLSPQGMSTGGQASAADVARLIDQIRTHKVTALFVENISDPRLIKQLQKDTGAIIGGTLYSDALSRENGEATTYVDMIRHNVTLLVEAMKKNPD